MRPPEVAPDGEPSATPKGTRIKAATRAVRMPELLLGMGPRRWQRFIGGLVLALGGAAAVTAIVNAIDQPSPFVIAALLFLVPITAATYIGGRWAGLLCAAASFACLVYFYSNPVREWAWPHHVEDYVALGVFLIVAALLSNALSRERAARGVSEVAQRRLAFLAAANEIIARTALDLDKTLHELANVTVPSIADFCVVNMVNDERLIQTMAVASGPPVRPALAENLMHQPKLDPDDDNAVSQVVRTGKAMLFRSVDDAVLSGVGRSSDHLALLRGLRIRSLMIVPLPARGGIIGAMTIGSVRSGRRYSDEELTLASDLAVRAGTALENVRLYEERDRAAHALQRSLLPSRLPDIPGAEIAARFQPFTEADLIGGDFYDVFEVGPRSWALVIGDVCGKGSEAAALTGLARHTIRAAALSLSSPAEILGVLNQAILKNEEDRYATATVVRVDLLDGHARAVVAAGGHPSPIVMFESGSVEEVGGCGLLLGVFEDATHTDTSVELHPGDGLVLYTDGLLDERQAQPELRLLSIVSDARGLSAADLADRIETTATRADVVYDDRAVLVLRLLKPKTS
ncbi:MAG TPA: SpoIIE family protein phosphatase [Actinomycetota bacterium]|nr:SpoIIE family protein phosphatase [Actinomycetota bacterium]